ncbi:MAG: class II glutamine amidotransferase [Candidatus Methanosuratincola petrocarbonis]
MCQLLGVCSNKKVDVLLSLRGFKHRGEYNPHGWGFAFAGDGGEWDLIKKPSSLAREPNVEENFRKYKSKIIIGHVRHASCGNQTHENTHPFKIGEWVFAHNGTVTRIMSLPDFSLNELRPQGKTDSEYAFCYLLEKIGKRKNIEKIAEILTSESEKIRACGPGSFNYLLSNGDVLFAYGDDRLHFVKREPPFLQVALRDEEYSVDLGEIKDRDERAILVATEPLTKDEKWEKFSGLRVFSDGEEVQWQ